MRVEFLFEDGKDSSALESLLSELDGIDIQDLEAKVQETAFNPMWIIFAIQLLMWLRKLNNPDAPDIPLPPLPPLETKGPEVA